MSDQSLERWEADLRRRAKAFPYPPTPDLAGRVRLRLAQPVPRPSPRRRWGLAMLIALLILGGLLAVPQVRAAVVSVLRVGAVRIFLTDPTPTVMSPTASPEAAAAVRPRSTATAFVSTTAPTTAPDEKLTLAEAATRVDFPLKSPAYPADLGPPDETVVEDMGGAVVISVWFRPDQAWTDQVDQVRLLLYQVGQGPFLAKLMPADVTEVTVKGQPALWTEGPYMLQFLRQGRPISGTQRTMEGSALIWDEDGITYRLEGQFSLAEATKIAESLRPLFLAK